MEIPEPADAAGPAEVPAVDPLAEANQRKLLRKSRFLGGAVYGIVRTIFATLRLKCENLDRALPSNGRGVILVSWHGRSMIPAVVFRNRGYWALISLSRDGELQNNIFSRCGFRIIRGSTGRGGIRGALQMARRVQEGGVLTFTPDGPRGPTHKVQPGVILMAQKSGAPIVPIGVSSSSRWLIKSWDSYMIPKPFARASMILGDPIYVPPKITEEERAQLCERVEIAINALECEAERRCGHLDYPAEWRTK
jgi:lysophospholipid acyltransferase (LPLAT)-like uncharacterized protein